MFLNKRRAKPRQTPARQKTKPADEIMRLAELDIRIIRSHRKSISLHIKPEGIILRAPIYSPNVALKAFALSKIDWLRKHHQRIQSKTQHINREYTDGEVWLLFGQNITLRIGSGNTSNTEYSPEKKELLITVGSRVRNTQSFIKKNLEDWYKEVAAEYLTAAVPALAGLMNVKHQDINVRDYKARWGSCSASANLSFNWRIFMAPTPVINSVIVHELAHIKHFNHSKKFWNLVYLHCPDYKKQHVWLKENQYLLQA